jgi:hypothetical protein
VAIKYGQSRETGNTGFISCLYESTGHKAIVVYAMNEQQFS